MFRSGYPLSYWLEMGLSWGLFVAVNNEVMGYRMKIRR